MARQKTKAIISVAEVKRLFGLVVKNLDDRKVEKQFDDDGKVGYYLDDVWLNCGDLIYSRLHSQYALDGDCSEQLKIEKLREEARKLRIRNDREEGLLVPAVDVEVAITKGLRSVADSMDSIVTQFVMNNPSVTPAQIDSLNKILTDVRNKIAEVGISYD